MACSSWRPCLTKLDRLHKRWDLAAVCADAFAVAQVRGCERSAHHVHWVRVMGGTPSPELLMKIWPRHPRSVYSWTVTDAPVHTWQSSPPQSGLGLACVREQCATPPGNGQRPKQPRTRMRPRTTRWKRPQTASERKHKHCSWPTRLPHKGSTKKWTSRVNTT